MHGMYGDQPVRDRVGGAMEPPSRSSRTAARNAAALHAQRTRAAQLSCARALRMQCSCVARCSPAAAAGGLHGTSHAVPDWLVSIHAMHVTPVCHCHCRWHHWATVAGPDYGPRPNGDFLDLCRLLVPKSMIPRITQMTRL